MTLIARVIHIITVRSFVVCGEDDVKISRFNSLWCYVKITALLLVCMYPIGRLKSGIHMCGKSMWRVKYVCDDVTSGNLLCNTCAI